MIPPVTHSIWAQVVTGNREVPPSKVGLNMLVANVRRDYEVNPSAASLRHLVARMHEFFAKYGTFYQAELEQILKRDTHA